MNAEDLVLNFKKGMANLSKTERRRAIESVRDVIRAAAFDDAAGSAYEIERCPRCGSAAVVKKGKSKNGEQRYLCRGCGRTFGMGSERILGTSKLPKETWMAYAECFVLMLPLRECARRCRVCLKTAYTMRHRLIECLSAYSPSFRVERGCGCELDETYFPESFKGNHAKGSFTMPRPSRHRGKQVHRRGLSRERICVMTGVNDSNETFLEVTGRGALSRERAMDALRGRIAAGSVVATDRAAANPAVQGRVDEAPRRLPRLVQVVPDLHGDRFRRGRAHGRAAARARRLQEPRPRHVQRGAALHGLLGRARRIEAVEWSHRDTRGGVRPCRRTYRPRRSASTRRSRGRPRPSWTSSACPCPPPSTRSSGRSSERAGCRSR